MGHFIGHGMAWEPPVRHSDGIYLINQEIDSSALVLIYIYIYKGLPPVPPTPDGFLWKKAKKPRDDCGRIWSTWRSVCCM